MNAKPPAPLPSLTPAEIAAIRLDYTRAGLREEDADPSPFAQFDRWFREAIAASVLEANAMTLATATPDGTPSARVVLVKGYDERGLTFFTNYESAKGRELAENPRAAVAFFWRELERQVRITGTVERTSRDESEAYFRSRPRGSRLGAWASPQSAPVADRAAIEARLEGVEARFAEGDVPCPPFWGGFRLVPSAFEFWQGRPSRLHDRLHYARTAGGWTRVRLAP